MASPRLRARDVRSCRARLTPNPRFASPPRVQLEDGHQDVDDLVDPASGCP